MYTKTLYRSHNAHDAYDAHNAHEEILSYKRI